MSAVTGYQLSERGCELAAGVEATAEAARGLVDEMVAGLRGLEGELGDLLDRVAADGIELTMLTVMGLTDQEPYAGAWAAAMGVRRATDVVENGLS